LEAAPRRRGRPPGVRNKPKPLVPPSTVPHEDYRHADPAAIVSRQLSMLDWAQQALRNELKAGYQARGTTIDHRDVEKLEKLSNAIVRAMVAMQKLADITDELAKRMTPEQLLEAALKKVEGQDAATIRYAIKRLRAYVVEIGGNTRGSNMQMGDGKYSAVDAIAGLDDEV
jgi:alcohol dehydrogenase YqhD (iron-dependent ADH family)